MNDVNVLVGVYGTLRKGCGAEARLGNAELVDTIEVLIPYAMYSTGPYPVLVSTNSINKIVFEVYNIKHSETLRELDAYEGYPDLYGKETIETELGDVIIYTGGDSLKEYVKNGYFEQITSGDWAKHRQTIEKEAIEAFRSSTFISSTSI